MKRTILIITIIVLLLLGAFTVRSIVNNDDGSPYFIGRVTLVADEVEHEPFHMFLHGLFCNGIDCTSASALPVLYQLERGERHEGRMRAIPYTDDLRILIEGSNWEVIPPGSREGMPAEYDGMRTVGISADNFTNGMSVSPPDETGTYLMYIDVFWRGRGEEFSHERYVFQIVR